MHNFQEILGFQQRDNKINVLLWIYDDKIIVYKYEFLPYTKMSLTLFQNVSFILFANMLR